MRALELGAVAGSTVVDKPVPVVAQLLGLGRFVPPEFPEDGLELAREKVPLDGARVSGEPVADTGFDGQDWRKTCCCPWPELSHD